ncbi:hypothetical protein D3C71_190020 [compost metagenome]
MAPASPDDAPGGLRMSASTDGRDPAFAGAQLRQVAATAGGRQSSFYQENSEIEPRMKIAYGFRDAGRGTVMGDDGEPLGKASREIICFDGPGDDPVLHSLMVHARAADRAAAGILERVKILSEVVIRAMEENDDRRNWSRMWNICEGDPAGRKVRLGDLIAHDTGVCRHRSLLFKVLADHVGMPAGLVRGFFTMGQFRQGHAWNEVIDESGVMHVVDTMVARMAPASGPLCEQYLTHDKERAYIADGHVFSFDPDALNPALMAKNGREGIELDIRDLDPEATLELMTFMRQGGARGDVVQSSARGTVLRFFGASNISAVERSLLRLVGAERSQKDSISLA